MYCNPLFIELNYRTDLLQLTFKIDVKLYISESAMSDYKIFKTTASNWPKVCQPWRLESF